MTATILPPTDAIHTDSKCLECGCAFRTYLRETRFYQRFGLTPPKRCSKCRESRREAKKNAVGYVGTNPCGCPTVWIGSDEAILPKTFEYGLLGVTLHKMTLEESRKIPLVDCPHDTRIKPVPTSRPRQAVPPAV